MRTTVDIDPDLLRRLRREAHEQGLSMKEVLDRTLRRGLAAPVTRREPYSCPSFAMGAPLRPLDKALALADALGEEETSRKLALRK